MNEMDDVPTTACRHRPRHLRTPVPKPLAELPGMGNSSRRKARARAWASLVSRPRVLLTRSLVRSGCARYTALWSVRPRRVRSRAHTRFISWSPSRPKWNIVPPPITHITASHQSRSQKRRQRKKGERDNGIPALRVSDDVYPVLVGRCTKVDLGCALSILLLNLGPVLGAAVLHAHRPFHPRLLAPCLLRIRPRSRKNHSNARTTFTHHTPSLYTPSSTTHPIFSLAGPAAHLPTHLPPFAFSPPPPSPPSVTIVSPSQPDPFAHHAVHVCHPPQATPHSPQGAQPKGHQAPGQRSCPSSSRDNRHHHSIRVQSPRASRDDPRTSSSWVETTAQCTQDGRGHCTRSEGQSCAESLCIEAEHGPLPGNVG